ncbi:hypothetical protein TYRP_017489 [Tyrophagus putrescentiae]|nr:hypothetical protein TYRP_017489 [Tyrophagus putrescentiae]
MTSMFFGVLRCSSVFFGFKYGTTTRCTKINACKSASAVQHSKNGPQSSSSFSSRQQLWYNCDD